MRLIALILMLVTNICLYAGADEGCVNHTKYFDVSPEEVFDDFERYCLDRQVECNKDACDMLFDAWYDQYMRKLTFLYHAYKMGFEDNSTVQYEVERMVKEIITQDNSFATDKLIFARNDITEEEYERISNILDCLYNYKIVRNIAGMSDDDITDQLRKSDVVVNMWPFVPDRYIDTVIDTMAIGNITIVKNDEGEKICIHLMKKEKVDNSIIGVDENEYIYMRQYQKYKMKFYDSVICNSNILINYELCGMVYNSIGNYLFEGIIQDEYLDDVKEEIIARYSYEGKQISITVSDFISMYNSKLIRPSIVSLTDVAKYIQDSICRNYIYNKTVENNYFNNEEYFVKKASFLKKMMVYYYTEYYLDSYIIINEGEGLRRYRDSYKERIMPDLCSVMIVEFNDKSSAFHFHREVNNKETNGNVEQILDKYSDDVMCIEGEVQLDVNNSEYVKKIIDNLCFIETGESTMPYQYKNKIIVMIKLSVDRMGPMLYKNAKPDIVDAMQKERKTNIENLFYNFLKDKVSINGLNKDKLKKLILSAQRKD